jgi:hypothetical protein
MSAKTFKSKVEPILDVVANAAATVTTTATESPIAASGAKAIAVGLDVANTVVTSLLDALEELRTAVRGVATASIEYGDNVARGASTASRNIVERLDLAAGTVIAGTRKVALDAIESARTAVPAPAAAPVPTVAVASA